jgi:hypothetical protein
MRRALLIFSIAFAATAHSAPAAEEECSTDAECQLVANSMKLPPKGALWTLAARNHYPDRGPVEVWRDQHTGLLWGDQSYVQYTQYQAIGEDPRGRKLAVGACDGGDALESNAQLTGFRLPTLEEFRQAEDDGMRFVLPRLSASFWTSTLWAGRDRIAYTFDGRSGRPGQLMRAQLESVRCVRR